MAGLNKRDELHEPLGLTPPAPLRVPWRLIAFAGVAAIAVGAGVYAVGTDDHMGGEPYAIASVDLHPPPPPPPAHQPALAGTAPDTTPTGSVLPAPARPPGQSTAGDLEASNGIKVVRGGGASAPGSLIISVPEAIGMHLTPAPDPRLVERSKYGVLPRIGDDGTRPSQVYARPLLVAEKLRIGAPRVALLVGGLGLSESGTLDAIARLPGAVSLGFAPYGADVARDVASARDAGHEVVLQLPMEPFDYPANNPGAHTLLTGLSEAENRDSLHWLMTRFTGYVGVMNYLGAKFTADRSALSPVLGEVASRGLLYLDDGGSPRSLAREQAAAARLPSAGADVVIDADPSPQAIDAALVRLEALARANGAAIGVAAALPASVDHVGRWARSLEARGVALVPVSAVAARDPGPAARANP
jgi:polysaccharide deacetylase 2 family uncharacterized protein YibQ